MIVTIKKEVKIQDVETWHIVAPPKSPDKQWKNGRSAKELARFATDPSFTEFIKKVLKDLGIKEQDFECEPEAETRFEKQKNESIDFGVSGPRNHDLLMIGKDCVIGLEAKVSEKFGNNTIKEEWEKAKTANKKEKRIPGLIEFLTNGEIKDYSQTPDSIKGLQYQLLTATAGTILEAKRRNKKEAIVLVLVFTNKVAKEKGYDANVEKNNNAFKNFEKKFFDKGKTTIQGIECKIKKCEVEIKSNYFFE